MHSITDVEKERERVREEKKCGWLMENKKSEEENVENNMQIKAFQRELMRDLNDLSSELSAAFSVHVVGCGALAEGEKKYLNKFARVLNYWFKSTVSTV